ncbi:hypothetical protein [Salinactinospora qingdaonensis]
MAVAVLVGAASRPEVARILVPSDRRDRMWHAAPRFQLREIADAAA